MSAVLWTLVAVAAVSLLSLVGAVGLSFGALRRHGVLMFLVALAAGTLIGDAFLHLLPEAASEHGFGTRIGFNVLIGFLFMFVLEVGLRWQHAHIEHMEGHAGNAPHAPAHGHPEVAPFGWLNLVGDAFHNLLDGAVIAAAFLIDTAVGLATAVAVAFHEIPQELGDFAVLIRAGFSPAKALALNLASALLALVGAAAVLVAGLPAETLETTALPLIAGFFLYIAAADLIPELHHHTRGRDVFIIVIGLLLGIALMAGLLGAEGLFEGGEEASAHA